MLTVLPKSWSLRKIEQEFGASNSNPNDPNYNKGFAAVLYCMPSRTMSIRCTCHIGTITLLMADWLDS